MKGLITKARRRVAARSPIRSRQWIAGRPFSRLQFSLPLFRDVDGVAGVDPDPHLAVEDTVQILGLAVDDDRLVAELVHNPQPAQGEIHLLLVIGLRPHHPQEAIWTWKGELVSLERLLYLPAHRTSRTISPPFSDAHTTRSLRRPFPLPKLGFRVRIHPDE